MFKVQFSFTGQAEGTQGTEKAASLFAFLNPAHMLVDARTVDSPATVRAETAIDYTEVPDKGMGYVKSGPAVFSTLQK